MPSLRIVAGRSKEEGLMFKLVQSYSGDWFVIPEEMSSEQFIEDEMDEGNIEYARYVELHRFRFKEFTE